MLLERSSDRAGRRLTRPIDGAGEEPEAGLGAVHPDMAQRAGGPVGQGEPGGPARDMAQPARGKPAPGGPGGSRPRRRRSGPREPEVGPVRGSSSVFFFSSYLLHRSIFS
jgi:hypothetical protein